MSEERVAFSWRLRGVSEEAEMDSSNKAAIVSSRPVVYVVGEVGSTKVTYTSGRLFISSPLTEVAFTDAEVQPLIDTILDAVALYRAEIAKWQRVETAEPALRDIGHIDY